MYKTNSIKRDVFKFHRFGRKGYSLFASLGREVLIGTLSVVTLSHAKADGVSVEPVTTDTVNVPTDRELALDEVSITGSRAPLTRSQAARMVTVLERKDIAQAPVQSINDLLKYAVGADVRQRGPIGAQTDISLRGSNYEQITILLNGINICDPQTGHNTFDFPVDISEIERIEILEGPAGRVYGTSSLLGAINIITKTPTRTSIDAHAEAGSYGYAAAGARANIAKGRWNNQLSGGYTRSDGYSRNKAGGLNADFRGGRAFYQGNYADEDVTVKWHAGMSTKDFGSNTFYGVKWDDQFEHITKTFTAIQAENRRGRLHFKPAIYWNRTADRFELYRDAPEKVKFNYHRSDVFGVNINSYFDWTLGRTAIGAELRNEDVVSTTLGEPLDKPHHIHGTDRDYTGGLNRTNISFVVEHNILLRRFTLSAGLVAAKNSWNNMNMKVYPGIDASYRIGNDWKVYASWNTSLRMPSVTELYYTQAGYKADKYLKPEEMSAFEAGMKYGGQGITASAAMYYNHCTNLIDWIRHTELGPDAPWESVNFAEVNAVGVSASIRFDFTRLMPGQKILNSLDVAYSYIDQSKDDRTGIQSKYSLEYLRHKVVASLQADIMPTLRLGVYYRFQERTGTYADANGTVLSYSPYSLFDARLSWHTAKYKLYLEANNIFDKSYVDYGNIPQPGTWIMAGAAFNVEL